MLEVEERKKEMPYGADVAFHCQRCGGFVDESGKCLFCGSQNRLRYKPTSDLQFYIEIDKEKKFYFNHITRMDSIDIDAPMIEVESFEDTTKRYIQGRSTSFGTLDFEFKANKDTIFKTDLLRDTRLFTLNMALKGMPKIMRMRIDYIGNTTHIMGSDKEDIFQMKMIIHDMDGWVNSNLEAPDGARCPNCGAPVRKTYGLCDYCGGWVEYR